MTLDVEGAVRDRPAEVEVTAEMVEAGWAVATDLDIELHDPADDLGRIFKAMLEAARILRNQGHIV